ncbi:MAG: energy-coupling factor transporter transmembrane component T [Ethanoligenens sp.]
MSNVTRYLDPRSKLLMLVLLNVLVFTSLPLFLEGACVALLCVAFFYQKDIHSIWKTLLQYAVLLFLSVLVFRSPGTIASMFGVLIMLSRKMFPLILCAKLLMDSPPGMIISALRVWRIPQQYIVAFTVSLRFFPTVKEEFFCVLDAMTVRGLRVNVGNILLHPALMTEYILVPMIQRLSVISDELSAAAITRGIESDRSRTSYYTLQIGFADVLFPGLFAALAVLNMLLQVGVIS